MTLSLRSPAGYGPFSALFQSQPISDFPTNFAISFWIGGEFKTSQPLLLTRPQAMRSTQIGVVGGATWNMSPLFWFGDPACNAIDFQPVEPVNRVVPLPNYSWMIGTSVSSAGLLTGLEFFVPSTNYSNQGLRYDDFPTDLGFTNSTGSYGKILNGTYRWDPARLNHVFITYRRFQYWYDWAVRTTVIVNGSFDSGYFTYVTPLKPTGSERLCIGSPAIPMDASNEIVIDDFRVYELALDAPPYDRTPGANWNYQAALTTWEMAQEIGYNRGRDRVNSGIYAQIPFMNLSPGAAYPNGNTFQDTTKRLTFTAATSGSLLSQAPVNPPSIRPILGRSGRNRTPANVQHIPVAFQGRTDTYNEEYAFEGCFVDSDDTRIWNPAQCGAFPAALNFPNIVNVTASTLRRADCVTTFAGASMVGA